MGQNMSNTEQTESQKRYLEEIKEALEYSWNNLAVYKIEKIQKVLKPLGYEIIGFSGNNDPTLQLHFLGIPDSPGDDFGSPADGSESNVVKKTSKTFLETFKATIS